MPIADWRLRWTDMHKLLRPTDERFPKDKPHVQAHDLGWVIRFPDDPMCSLVASTVGELERCERQLRAGSGEARVSQAPRSASLTAESSPGRGGWTAN